MNSELWVIADGFLPMPPVEGLKAFAPKSKGKATRAPAVDREGVAVVDVSGVLTKHGDAWADGTSYLDIAAAIERYAADESVKRIILRIDSPGGAVRGVHEAADAIYQNRHKVTAIIDGYGASAAYWLASQASQVYATRGSIIGSVGTKMLLIDTSALMERVGIRVIPIATGDYKAAGETGTKITEDHVNYFVSLTRDIHAGFRADVQRTRKLEKGQMAVVDSAGVFTAAAAKNFGLIDGVQSLDDTLNWLGFTKKRATQMERFAAKQARFTHLDRGQY